MILDGKGQILSEISQSKSGGKETYFAGNGK